MPKSGPEELNRPKLCQLRYIHRNEILIVFLQKIINQLKREIQLQKPAICQKQMNR